MKIYTKTGDSGSTSLFGGKRVSKSDVRIHAYGTVDELNSWMGLLSDQEINQDRRALLTGIQNCLFVIGSMLAAEPGNEKIKIPHIREEDILILERSIDAMELVLPPMRNFILPGGHPAVSYCHIARTVCRRAERYTIQLSETETVDPVIVKFLNRLSDFLFVLSRKMAMELHVEETPWKPQDKS